MALETDQTNSYIICRPNLQRVDISRKSTIILSTPRLMPNPYHYIKKEVINASINSKAKIGLESIYPRAFGAYKNTLARSINHVPFESVFSFLLSQYPCSINL